MSARKIILAVTLLLLARDQARADRRSPLEEMRQAASAAAVVDPDLVPPPRVPIVAHAGPDGSRRDAVQQAVRAEVDREWADRVAGRGPGTLPPGQGGQPPGQSTSAQARGAAAQAQDAARNKDVAQERGRGRPDAPGKSVGRSTVKGAN